MREVFTEFIAGARFRRNNAGKQEISVFTKIGAYYDYGTMPLVLLDGVPVTDHDAVFNYNPLSVERINVYYGPIIIGGTQFDGIVEFITYRRLHTDLNMNRSSQIVSYEGPQSPYLFAPPNYSEDINRQSRMPDSRHTLLWNPDVKTDGKTSIRLPFDTSDLTGEFQATVQGITKDGKIIFATSFFNVTPTSEIVSDEADIKTVTFDNISDVPIAIEEEMAVVMEEEVVEVIEVVAEVKETIAVTTGIEQKSDLIEVQETLPVLEVAPEEPVAVMPVEENIEQPVIVEIEIIPDKPLELESIIPNAITVIEEVLTDKVVVDEVIAAEVVEMVIIPAVTEVSNEPATSTVKALSVNYTMTAQPYTGTMWIFVTGSGAVEIDWGEVKTTHTLSANGSSISHTYSGTLPRIFISGENITRLQSSGNQLISLDVSNHAALTHLECDNNQLTSLDMSNNSALTTLNCRNNQLSAEALNALFETLHSNNIPFRPKHIYIGGNPGANACDRSIAERKGWIVY
jgi:hypothetical protein